MAGSGVLEKRERRLYLDDTTPLAATITTHRMETSGKSSHAVYVIRVQRGPNPEDSWEVAHRYNEFYTLSQVLQPCGMDLKLPPKTWSRGKTDRQHLLERQQGLQVFLDAVMSQPLLSRHFEVKKFLDPANYSPSFHEDALRNVSMFFRSEPTWSVVQPLKDIGWRIRKQYYLIASKVDTRIPKHMLSWCEPGPDASLGEREMEACFKSLIDIKHPYILPPVLARYTGGGMMIVREFIPTGSLRDAIHGQKLDLPVIQKYSPMATRGRPLSVGDVAKYGRQILEALIFLSEKGFVLGQVHAGNVLLHKGDCKLVDIENSLLGVPSLHRHHLVGTRRLHGHEAETVYCFGHLLYEMSTGSELKTPFLETVGTVPAGVEPVLQRILTQKGMKENFPTLSNLREEALFSSVHIPPGGKPLMKVSSKLKEVLKEHISKMEQRLLEEQRKVSQLRRLSRAQESIMSEEEKRKRRKLRKKQMSLQDSVEPEAYPTTTSLPRQNTIGTSGVTASSAVRSKSTSAPPPTGTAGAKQASSSTSSRKASATPKAPPPPSAPAPPPQSPPPSGERGALLSSIHTFSKGGLKKTKTKDSSAPKL